MRQGKGVKRNFTGSSNDLEIIFRMFIMNEILRNNNLKGKKGKNV